MHVKASTYVAGVVSGFLRRQPCSAGETLCIDVALLRGNLWHLADVEVEARGHKDLIRAVRRRVLQQVQRQGMRSCVAIAF